MPAKLFLVRHAEPFFPEGERVYLGRRLDYPLSEKGRMQARETAEELSKEGVVRVYSSPMKRCLETAAAIAEACGCGVTVMDELTELDPGTWEGRRARDIRLEYGERFENGSCFPPPGGESDESGAERIEAAFGTIMKTQGNAVIVSHGGLIRIMLSLMTGISDSRKRAFNVRYAVPVPVTVNEDGTFAPDMRFIRERGN